MVLILWLVSLWVSGYMRFPSTSALSPQGNSINLDGATWFYLASRGATIHHSEWSFETYWGGLIVAHARSKFDATDLPSSKGMVRYPYADYLNTHISCGGGKLTSMQHAFPRAAESSGPDYWLQYSQLKTATASTTMLVLPLWIFTIPFAIVVLATCLRRKSA